TPRATRRRSRAESAGSDPSTSRGGRARAASRSALRWRRSCKRSSCHTASRTQMAATRSATTRPTRSRRSILILASFWPHFGLILATFWSHRPPRTSASFSTRDSRRTAASRRRAAALGPFGRLLEPRLIEARHPPLHLELHLGDLGCPVHHFQGARGGGLHPGHGLPGFFEAGRQGHAEAGGVRRGNQLFGVRAFLPLEPSRERVRTVERAAAGLEVPLPVLELAFPDRHRLTRGHRPTPLKVRVGNLAEPLRGRYAWDARRLRLRGQPTMATKKKPKKKPRRPLRQQPE